MANSADAKKLFDLLRQLEIPRKDAILSLTAAAMDGDLAMAQAFLDAGADIEERSIGFASPLQAAVHFGHLEVVDLLLKHRADSKKKKDALHSPLESAVPRINIFKRLMESGADISAEPDLIIYASMGGHAATLRILLQNEVQTKRLAYALFKAAKSNRLECVKLLMDAGAATKDADTFKNTLDDARTANNATLVALLDGKPVDPAALAVTGAVVPQRLKVDLKQREALEKEAVRVIESLNGKINEIDARKETPPLVAAAAYNLPLALDALLKAGANVDVRGKDGQTPLLFAAERGHFALAQRLLEAGADVNAANDYKYTALLFACWRGDPELVKILLAAGANTNVKGKDKVTPLTAARGLHKEEIRRMLSEAGPAKGKQKK